MDSNRTAVTWTSIKHILRFSNSMKRTIIANMKWINTLMETFNLICLWNKFIVFFYLSYAMFYVCKLAKMWNKHRNVRYITKSANRNVHHTNNTTLVIDNLNWIQLVLHNGIVLFKMKLTWNPKTCNYRNV